MTGAQAIARRSMLATVAGAAVQRLDDAAHCAEIATGAVMPDGADCMVQYELTQREGDHIVVQALVGAPWGTFTVAATIPIALFMGIYLRTLRPGKVLEASVIGVLLLL